MDVLMPQLGETVAEGKISKWFVAAGDAVKPGDNLFEIETDKVSMEVPAITAGTLAAIHVQAGEVAPVGAVVAIIQGSGETLSLSKPQTPLTPAKAGVQGQELGHRFRGDERLERPAPIRQMEPFREVRTPERNYGPARLPGGTVVTPLARRLAGETGIDLAKVKGSGPHGRIVAADIESARSAKPASPALAQNLAVATITLTADVQLAQALALCAEVPAIQLADIVVKAWATALARMAFEHPGIALAIGKSRFAMVGAAGLSLTAIAARRESGAAGGTNAATTAISMPGVPGITSVVDALALEHIAMLSVGATRRAPVEAADGGVKFIDLMTVTLSSDHRVVDAARGAELLAAFKRFVEQPVTMIV
jgi:pyruvate/2-oxoglutarate dehydrogenase complex dihydrolipoamide acyltransferase (E2) component